MNYTIEKMIPSHWKQVYKIYYDGIMTGKATFQTQTPTWEEWDRGHLKECRYVATIGETVIGWVALSPTSARACYAGVMEVSIYIGNEFKGVGIGTALLNQVIEASEKQSIWSLYCAIIEENVESIALHKKCGFREIGYREKIAQMSNGVWHDVVLMERRSLVVGRN